MAKWQDIKGGVVADSVYDDGVLVAKDTAFTLPGLAFQTATVKAMGDMDVAMIGLLENMQLTVTKIGIDKGLGRMNRLKKHNLEFRWVQNVVKADGSVTVEGLKARLRTTPSSTPEIGVELGNASEAENTYNVTRMEIYAAGEEIICVDRLAQVLRVDGVDYMKQINNLL